MLSYHFRQLYELKELCKIGDTSFYNDCMNWLGINRTEERKSEHDQFIKRHKNASILDILVFLCAKYGKDIVVIKESSKNSCARMPEATPSRVSFCVWANQVVNGTSHRYNWSIDFECCYRDDDKCELVGNDDDFDDIRKLECNFIFQDHDQIYVIQPCCENVDHATCQGRIPQGKGDRTFSGTSFEYCCGFNGIYNNAFYIMSCAGFLSLPEEGSTEKVLSHVRSLFPQFLQCPSLCQSFDLLPKVCIEAYHGEYKSQEHLCQSGPWLHLGRSAFDAAIYDTVLDVVKFFPEEDDKYMKMFFAPLTTSIRSELHSTSSSVYKCCDASFKNFASLKTHFFESTGTSREKLNRSERTLWEYTMREFERKYSQDVGKLFLQLSYELASSKNGHSVLNNDECMSKRCMHLAYCCAVENADHHKVLPFYSAKASKKGTLISNPSEEGKCFAMTHIKISFEILLDN